MSNKTIQLNPVFLNQSSKSKTTATTTTKTLKKEKPVSALIKPNKVKKELLAKIKDFQMKAEEKGITHKIEHQVEEFDKGFNDEFNKSLNFLQELSKQKVQQKVQQKNDRKNTTLKKGKIENEVHMHVATELPMELQQTHAVQPQQQVQRQKVQVQPQQVQVQPQQVQVQPQQVQQQVQYVQHAKTPPYGILKQGIKPTYREWHNKTQKLHYPINDPKPLIKIEQEQDNSNTIPSERSKNLELFKQEYKQKIQNTEAAKPLIVPVPVPAPISVPTHVPAPAYKKRITKTTKYKLGKTKGSNKVSVLIKNNQTRRKVQHEISLLRQKPILEIKNYLREKNLLKIGSFAPNDVLRQMYEQSILAGDVENKSKDTLIHNFYNDK